MLWFLSSWIICWGKGNSAQLTLFRLPLSAASVITFFNLDSISSLVIPLIMDSGLKHRCTYRRTEGGQSIFFLAGAEETGVVAGNCWCRNGCGW